MKVLVQTVLPVGFFTAHHEFEHNAVAEGLFAGIKSVCGCHDGDLIVACGKCRNVLCAEKCDGRAGRIVAL